MPADTLIQVRQGTAAQWTTANPILASGEPGFETDTGKFKFGNGTSSWTLLAYASPTSTALMGVVNHGANATVARPTGYGSIHWIGSVQPSNAIDGDLWTSTA